jgi:hypothetical protein
VSVVYQRIPLVDILGTNVRVTLDYNLRCGGEVLLGRALRTTDRRLLPPGAAVLEIKYERKMPSWLFAALRRHQLVATRCSKYRLSIERYFDDSPLIDEVQGPWTSF